MNVLPPGTLLQLMYLQERIQQIPSGHFFEIGPGSGEITQLLIDHGWTGCSYDLDARTIENLKIRFAKEIAQQRFIAVNDDFLASHSTEKVDLVISSMVMEHLENDTQISFMNKSAEYLRKSGMMITIVPSSPAHWGIEDDIAGHYRRYTRESFQSLTTLCNWKLLHSASRTFPISNILLPVSNFLVNRHERTKLALSHLDRTKLSGRRQVKFKTYFPSIFGILINKYTLYPMYLLQKLFIKSERALVLYVELRPSHGVSE